MDVGPRGFGALVVIVGAGHTWGSHGGQRHCPPVARRGRVPRGEGTLSLLDRTLFDASELDEDTRGRIAAEFQSLKDMHPELPLTLEFRKFGDPNALALPNGTVIVIDKLVVISKNDDEIIAVLAHELGHVHHRHGLRAVIEGSAVALLAFGILGDASDVVALVGSLPVALTSTRYSRT